MVVFTITSMSRRSLRRYPNMVEFMWSFAIGHEVTSIASVIPLSFTTLSITSSKLVPLGGVTSTVITVRPALSLSLNEFMDIHFCSLLGICQPERSVGVLVAFVDKWYYYKPP